MKVILMIIVLYLCLINAQRHTKIYKNDWEKFNNADYRFYDPNTFGVNIYSGDDGCEIITNQQFRNEINTGIDCTGMWCTDDNKFRCLPNSLNCYHVDHIFDLHGTNFQNCEECKNMAANRVMIYGRWNSALGGLARNNYQDSLNEKEEIFGEKIMNKVYQKLLYCKNKLQSNNYLIDCDDSNECDCDSDYICGCDCDQENTQKIYVPINETSSTNFIEDAVITIMTLIFIILVLISFIVCISVSYYKYKKNNNFVKILNEEELNIQNFNL